MEILKALFVRKKFGTVLDKVFKKKEPIAISRNNQPLVVMVPYDVYQKTNDKKSREERLKEVLQRMDEWRRRNKEKLKGIDPAKIIREMRESK